MSISTPVWHEHFHSSPSDERTLGARPTSYWWVLPIAVPLELPHNEFMNNLEKITIGLLVLMSAAGISGWLLFNYMLDSIV
jgi:hypothetical protein